MIRLEDVKFRTIEDDMTADELKLFHRGPNYWGTLTERARRGALYLDRVIPDWYTYVTVKTLRLESACNCVLGQIFRQAADETTALPADDPVLRDLCERAGPGAGASTVAAGWAVGCAALNVRTDCTVDDDELPQPATMFGFDFGHSEVQDGTWDDLTAAWRREVTTRVEAAASE